MNRVKTQGFTLIELTLAMAFISMLLLAIALTVIQISQAYNRGLTLNEVDQASRTITTDISKDLGSTSGFSTANTAHRYVTQTWGGAVCFGDYSYVWNYGQAVAAYAQSTNNSLNLLVDNNGVKSPFNLVKVIDKGGALCADGTAKTIDSSTATELVNTTDHDLAVHEFCIASQPSAADPLTNQQLYTVSFAIGTNNTDALTNASANACTGTNETDSLTACKQPGMPGADLEYCTVQEFSLVVRAQNAVN